MRRRTTILRLYPQRIQALTQVLGDVSLNNLFKTSCINLQISYHAIC
ncbi:hypothetical protein RchiOBHm_Chr6g0271911 [Rosa chinensis]|uniref:Uncharacterized protein n=1 Tax=Rosa chinensis TaxID=74649 RepID=A0A2P6PR35_ROSCH|nr:hypothetical protein RchiOBHm_Chr6g0271911 [Rosa chinensis]